MNHSPPNRSKKIRLRFVLVVPFVLQISTAVALTTYLSFKNGQQAVNNLTIRLMDEVSWRIEERLHHYLPAEKPTNFGLSNITVANLNKFLHDLQISSSGQAFIIEVSGNIVASSTLENPFVPHLNSNKYPKLLATDSKNALTRITLQKLTDKFGNLANIRSPKKIYFFTENDHVFVTVRPYKYQPKFGFLIVVVAPESDFMAEINANTHKTIVLCIAVCVIAATLAIFSANWVTTPIGRLNTAAKKIAKGNLDQKVDIDGFDEVRELADSFNRMASQLQTNFADLKALNKALSQSESQLMQFLEALPLGFFIIGANQNILYANQTAQNLIGKAIELPSPAQELITNDQFYRANTNQVYPPEEFPIFLALWGEKVTVDDIEIHHNQKVIPLEVLATPIFDAEGQIIYVSVALQDITERKQAEKLLADYSRDLEKQVTERTAELARVNANLEREITERKQIEEALRKSETQLNNVLNSANASISSYRIFPNQRIEYEYFSDGQTQILGYNPTEIMADSYFWMWRVPPEDVETAILPALELILLEKTVSLEYRFYHKNGSLRWISETLTSRRDEAADCWIVTSVAVDITDRKQAEIALKEREEFLRSIYDGVEEAIFVIDVLENGEFRFVSTNPTHQKCTGLPLEQLKGKTPEEARLPDWEIAVQRYQECITTGKTITYEESVLLGGEQTYWYTTLTPLRDSNFRIYQLIGTTINTTTLKQTERALKHALQKLTYHVDNSPLGVIEWDANQNVLGWSKQAEKIFGWKAEEVLGLSWNALSFIEKQDEDKVQKIVNSLFSGIEIKNRHQNRNYTKDRSIIYCEWYNSVLFDESGNIVSLVSLVLDITERQQAEAELQQAKEAAETANRAKSIFLANMSHELRTPLNAISGFVQLLLRDEQISQRQRQKLEIINRNSYNLLELINDVLSISQIEANQLTINNNIFDFYSLLSRLLETFQLAAQSKGIQLIFDCHPNVPQYLLTDERKLRQILTNLIDNALKFTASGSVNLRVTLRQETRSLEEPETKKKYTLDFVVEDTGAGISPEEINTLFDNFVQTQTGRDSQQGTGLGLPISRRFVQLLGGDITVRSQPNLGTVFQFHIVVRSVKIVEAPTNKLCQRVVNLAADQPAYRILVVDDKEENRQLLAKLLSSVGFQVQEATDGYAAIELAETFAPHLILMDIQLPSIDGYEATRQIRVKSQGKETIIIAISASVFEEERQHVLAAGCDDFIPKPCSEDTIFDKISQYLGVQYVREDASPSLRSDPLLMPARIAEALAFMPREWLQRIHLAARCADEDEIFRLLKEIPDSQALLAEQLANFVNSFHLDRIIELTKSLLT